MKKYLSLILAIIMVASVFMMSGCMKKEDYYTESDVDKFVENLKTQIESKNQLALSEINSLKIEYTAKIDALEKVDTDLKAELKTLTNTYNAKVAEIEAEILAGTNALEAHKTAYEADLALLNKADADNKAEIEALTAT